MISKKSFHIECSDGFVLKPTILEVLDHSIFVWPSSLVLSAYLASRIMTKDSRVIELGAGTGLPSIVCAMMGAKRVHITERANERALDNLKNVVELNQVQENCSVWPLTWGFLKEDVIPDVDVILGADVFYSGEDYDAVLTTVACLMLKNTKAVFLTAYQNRR